MKLYFISNNCDCDPEPNYGTMKNVALMGVSDFLMVYGCPHVKVGSDKE